jgi:hypothetical protein
VKQQLAEADHSSPSNAEVKNGKLLPQNFSWHSDLLIKNKENFTISLYLLRILEILGSVLLLETSYADRSFAVFFTSLGKCRDLTSTDATTTSFYVLSNSLVTNYRISRRYIAQLLRRTSINLDK